MVMATEKLVPKQLAREFDLDEKWVREQLRREYGRHRVGRRWTWDGREANEIRAWMTKLLNGGGQS
jgi:hypothetical protein